MVAGDVWNVPSWIHARNGDQAIEPGLERSATDGD
jgi:hypothetical protein